MHDPLTQLLYHDRIGILWHVDPEHQGDDDSCDWFGSHLNPEFAAWLRKEGESQHQFWFGEHQTLIHASTLEVLFAVWTVIEWRRPDQGLPLYRRRFSHFRLRRRMRRAFLPLLFLAGNGSDNLGARVPEARASDEHGKRALGELFFLLARAMQGDLRPWWKHPRWHVHHWRLQLFFVQNLKRRLFTRCHVCGKGFAWGQTGVTNQWHSDGPRWFKSENLAHMRCAGVGLADDSDKKPPAAA